MRKSKMQGLSFMPENLSLHQVGSLSRQPQSSRSASWDHMGVAEFTRGMLSNTLKKNPHGPWDDVTGRA